MTIAAALKAYLLSLTGLGAVVGTRVNRGRRPTGANGELPCVVLTVTGGRRRRYVRGASPDRTVDFTLDILAATPEDADEVAALVRDPIAEATYPATWGDLTVGRAWLDDDQSEDWVVSPADKNGGVHVTTLTGSATYLHATS